MSFLARFSRGKNREAGSPLSYVGFFCLESVQFGLVNSVVKAIRI